MTSIRKLGALTLAVPLAIGIVTFGPITAAQAEGTGIKSPADKAVISSGSATTVTAHLDWLAVGNLYVDGPGSGGEQQIAGGTGPRDISGRVATSRNGPYVVRLKGLLGEVIDQQTFYVRVPPAQPTGVDTSMSAHKLVVRWDRGKESDLAGYDVFAAGAKARRGSTGALCSGQVCSTALSIPAAGGRTIVGVRALRPDGSGHLLASKLTKTSTLLPGARSYPGTRGLSGLPPAAANPLPLENSSPLSLPSVTPYGASPGFQYPASVPQVAAPAANSRAENASSSSPLQWGKSVAVAMILLIVAAHLGAWTRRQRIAQATAAAGTAVGSDSTHAQSGSTLAKGEPPIRDRNDESATARASTRPSPGSLIDAKDPAADATVLGTGGAVRPRSAAAGRAGDPAPAVNFPSPVVPAPVAAPPARASAVRKRPARRHTHGYRGRRRAG